MVPPLTAKYSVELGFSFDTHLGDNLTILRNAVLYQDFDCAILVDGKEGSGKSVLGMQVAHFLDVDRNLDIGLQICFTPGQFKKAVGSLKPGKAIVWDEARRGLNRRRHAQDVNLSITDMLAECRQNNLFLVIIMPSFYDMDLNVAIHRSRALIHVYYEWDPKSTNPLDRGYFRFYNEDAKSELYANKYLRQRYQYPYIRDKSFDSKFIHHYVVDEKAYRRLKRTAEADFQDEAKKAAAGLPLAQRKAERGKLIRFLRTNRWLREPTKACEAIAGLYGVTRQALYVWEDLNDDGTTQKEKARIEKTVQEHEELEKDRIMTLAESNASPAPGVTDLKDDNEEVLNGT